MLRYNRIGVTVKSDLDRKDEAVQKILKILEKIGVEICFDVHRKEGIASAKTVPTFSEEKEIDLLLVIGGDGTILRAARELKDFSIPILSVNRGNVGFLSEMTMDEAPK